MFFRKPAGISWLVVFLGNPGPKYSGTRHNAGFLTADAVEKRFGVSINRSRFKALTASCEINGEKVLFMKPQTYMNLSGESLREVMAFYKETPDHLIVVYDDFDIAAGNLRIRPFGSAGTHNGMRSVIYQLNTDRFPRIRIGTGREKKGNLFSFVTGGFSKEEVPLLEEAVFKAVEARKCIVEDDINLAMNKYNTKKKKKKKKKPETTAAKSGGGENQTGQPGPGPECESGSCGIPQAEPAAAPAEMTEKADSDDK